MTPQTCGHTTSLLPQVVLLGEDAFQVAGVGVVNFTSSNGVAVEAVGDITFGIHGFGAAVEGAAIGSSFAVDFTHCLTVLDEINIGMLSENFYANFVIIFKREAHPFLIEVNNSSLKVFNFTLTPKLEN